MSLWEDGWAPYAPHPSFTEPASDPGTDPRDGDQVQVTFGAAWLDVVRGCILQACQPPTWGDTGSSDATGVLGRATALLNQFGAAEPATMQESGVVTLTIPAGQAYASIVIDFVVPFVSTPVVVVGAEGERLVAYIMSKSAVGFTAYLAADVAVIDDTEGSFDYIASG